ncbi:tetratricopeptide repeat protein [Actinoplanes sp. NPDC026619]|uniref:tetratricopeptide repeat protein n=1 Tax=Actinoplanes sp. NPDC026619 TaxID=3155798 RepID=UPI00340C53A4
MNASSASVSLVHEALVLLRADRVEEAEAMMKRAVRRAGQLHGEHSAAWAAAQSDMGNVLLRADQPAWAVECFRAAVSVPVPPGGEPQHRLGHQLNLGIALTLSGRLEEGAEALRESRAGRLEFYGPDHVGYAAGLEPLADVLLRLGDHAGALAAIEEAVPIFDRAGHQRIASSVALRGVIRQAGGHSGPLFPGLHELPDHVVEQVATIAAIRVRQGIDPDAAYLFLAHLANALRTRLGPDHPSTVDAFSALSVAAGERGDHNGRVAALRRVLASYDRQDRVEEALAATISIAEALGDAGETDKSLLRYEDAASRAERTGHAGLIGQALFDWGLALQAAGKPEPATERLGEASAAARDGDDPVLLGHVAAAYGIGLQHLGRRAEARTALEECLSVLEPRDEAAGAARSHLVAILDDRECDCAGLRAAVEEGFRDFVMSRLPADLLGRFDVRIVGNNFVIDADFQREPAGDEAERFDEVVRAGQAEFSRQVAG